MSVVVHIKKLSNHKEIYIKRNKKLNHTTKHNTFKCYKVFPSHYQHFFIFVFLFIYFCFSLFLCFHIFITILLFNYLFSLSLDFQFLKIDILTLFGWNRFWNYIGCFHEGQVGLPPKENPGSTTTAETFRENEFEIFTNVGK